MSQTHSKYIALIAYFDKALLFLSAASVGLSVTSFATVIGVPFGITSASRSSVFSMR